MNKAALILSLHKEPSAGKRTDTNESRLRPTRQLDASQLLLERCGLWVIINGIWNNISLPFATTRRVRSFVYVMNDCFMALGGIGHQTRVLNYLIERDAKVVNAETRKDSQHNMIIIDWFEALQNAH